MGYIEKQLLWVAMLGIAGLCALPATAAPPNSRPSQSFAAQHLDLSAPTHFESSEKTSSFTSPMVHRQSLDARDEIQLPQLGSDSMSARPNMAELARRVHREGFPVARLWQGKSGFVHIGLNQKGKPGLWLVQKTH